MQLGMLQWGDGDDPKNPMPKPLTKEQLAAQVMFAKQFAARHGLMNAENMHVGNMGAPFVDEQGRPYKPDQSKSNIKLQTFVPPEVTELKEDGSGYPYFEDPQTGEPIHVPQEYRGLERFNPQRGTYDYNRSVAKK